MPKKCRVELQQVDNNWSKAFHFSRFHGLSMETRSFSFKLLRQIPPFNERLSHILPNNRSDCSLFTEQGSETQLHGLFTCVKDSIAAETLLTLTRPYDPSITAEKVLIFYINVCDPIYELPAMLTIATGLFSYGKTGCIRRGLLYITSGQSWKVNFMGF